MRTRREVEARSPSGAPIEVVSLAGKSREREVDFPRGPTELQRGTAGAEDVEAIIVAGREKRVKSAEPPVRRPGPEVPDGQTDGVATDGPRARPVLDRDKVARETDGLDDRAGATD